MPSRFKSLLPNQLTMNRIVLILILFSTMSCHANTASEQHDFKTQIIATGLKKPWALQFLPNGDFLITEHSGNLVRLNSDGQRTEISGLPDIKTKGQGGLLDIRLDAQFSSNQRLYFCYSAGDEDGYSTHLAKARLIENHVVNVVTLFEAEPKNSNGRHFGCRIEFDFDNYLYLSLGDLGERENSQNSSNHAGSVIRLNSDGSIPKDNPFPTNGSVKPEIFSYGHRNPQGMVLNPHSGQIWLHEHGPQGGDELNIIKPGGNFGWPIITYGVEYGSGDKIGKGYENEGMEQPIYYWVPSIAPSGMTFYDGEAFPKWKNSLFIGSLKFKLLVRLEFDGNSIVKEERLLKNEFGRIRDVRQGPDGLIYLLTDAGNGKLIRLVPTERQMKGLSSLLAED